MCIDKKSLVIYSFYDKDGVVDDYVLYALAEIKKVSSRIIVVVNGILNEEGREKINKYTTNISIRENVGMDAGAYKSILLEMSQNKELSKYNELILMNDTFFGPFVSFSDIFFEMRNKGVDYWGLNYIDHKLFDYIQSYFLVFGEKILKSGHIVDYFKEYIDEYTENWNTVCACFEVGLHRYLKHKGYTFSTYVFAGNGNLYKTSKASVEKYKLPILKKKAFLKDENVWQAVEWIGNNTLYDVELITNCIKRQYEIEKTSCSYDEENEFVKVPVANITEKEIDFFIESNDEIYIYGTGYWAQIIYYLFLKGKDNMKGFVVTSINNGERELFGLPITEYQHFYGKAGVILGLNPENTEQVIEIIDKDNNVLILW